MAKIGNQYFDGGTTPTAAQLNAVYNNVASGNINDVNLQTDWANREHFSPTIANRISQFYKFDYDGTTDWVTTSNTFTTIENIGGNKSQVLPNYSTHGNVVVRVQASGLVSTLGLTAAGDGNGTSGQTNYNTYAFRLFMSLNSSGTPSTVDLASSTYSFTQKAAITSITNSLSACIQYRSFAFSGLFALGPNNQIDSVELQACVGLNGNTLRVQHNHIQLIVVEN